MKPSAVVRMGLLAFVIGCFKGPYHKKDGQWYWKDVRMRVPAGERVTALSGVFATAGDAAFYRSSQIDSADGRTFVALSDDYAKDKRAAYYCDDYRDGKEYFSIKHTRVVTIAGADAASFRFLAYKYARDTANVYFGGERFPVADIASFELLDYLYARDHVSGYYLQQPVPGSDGRTFAAVDSHYSKDATHVFYSEISSTQDASRNVMKTTRLPGAQPASFTALDDGYASDSAQLYYQGKVLSDAKSPLQVLSFGYAKSGEHVYHRGELVKNANPASFATSSPPTSDVDATDANGQYLNGKRVKH